MTSTATPAHTPLFVIDDLHARPATRAGAGPSDDVLRGLDLTVAGGELHLILGPSDPGTRALGSALLGSPRYEVTAGSVWFRGDDVTDWATDERAKVGMFLAVRYPHELSGVSVIQLLRHAVSAHRGADLSVPELRLVAIAWFEHLGIDTSVIDRHLDETCSGVERQGIEIVQMAILEPELAILDHTDAAPDGDALRLVARGIRAVRRERPHTGVVLIAHDRRVLDEIEPDRVHVLADGHIVRSGGMELAEQLEPHACDLRAPV